MTFHPIKKKPGYFIEVTGRIFKIVNGREEDVPILRTKRTNRLYVNITGSHWDYLYLMIEYFKPEMKSTDQIKFKVGPNGLIHARSITIRPFTSGALSKEDELLEFKYQCATKANAANYRGKGIITSLQVFMTLKIHDFKCIYCQDKIHPLDWHLDHYYPISKDGINEFKNIVPACPTCNLMKGAIHPERFYSYCTKIATNYRFKDALLESAENNIPKSGIIKSEMLNFK